MARHSYDDSYFSGATGDVPVRRPSQTELESRAREYAVACGRPYEEVMRDLKAYYDKQEREPVPVWKFGDDPDDFDIDKTFAESMASDGHAVTRAFAWKNEDGEMVLMTQAEMRAYRKSHPGRRFSSD